MYILEDKHKKASGKISTNRVIDTRNIGFIETINLLRINKRRKTARIVCQNDAYRDILSAKINVHITMTGANPRTAIVARRYVPSNTKRVIVFDKKILEQHIAAYNSAICQLRYIEENTSNIISIGDARRQIAVDSHGVLHLMGEPYITTCPSSYEVEKRIKNGYKKLREKEKNNDNTKKPKN